MLNRIKLLERLKMKPISELADELPEKNITTYMLNALDFIVPNEWENVVGFENMIRVYSGETKTYRVEAIADHARDRYAHTNKYKRAIGLYRAVDLTDRVIAGAVVADKVGDRFGFLDFLDTLTPKSDTMQAIDFGMKLTVEIVAFSLLNGLPQDGIQAFVESLRQYSKENLMRMAALVSVDGLLTLGPDFIDKTGDLFDDITPEQLEENKIYQQIGDLIPRATASQRLDFIREAFAGVRDWMGNLTAARNLTTDNVLSNLRQAIDISDDKLDYVGAFLDATTNYFAHTGVQTVARHLILEAAATTPYRSRHEPAIAKRLGERRRRIGRRASSVVLPSQLDDLDGWGITDGGEWLSGEPRTMDWAELTHLHRLELEELKAKQSQEWQELKTRHQMEREGAKRQRRQEKRMAKEQRRAERRQRKERQRKERGKKGGAKMRRGDD